MSVDSIIKVFLLSIIEGLTEFIPVSSTGHLIIVSELIDFHSQNGTFEIAIQLGAILAVIVYYKAFFKHLLLTLPRQMILNLLLASLPVLILGFLFYDFIKSVLMTPVSIASALIVGSILMIFSDTRPSQKHDIHSLSFKNAFSIGCFQCLALWPGMSRSGATICGGLINKLDHAVAAQFSFILGVPIIGAAVGYDLLKSFHTLSMDDIYAISLGCFFSFFISLFTIRYFLKLLSKTKLLPFAIYRIVIACGILFFFS